MTIGTIAVFAAWAILCALYAVSVYRANADHMRCTGCGSVRVRELCDDAWECLRCGNVFATAEGNARQRQAMVEADTDEGDNAA